MIDFNAIKSNLAKRQGGHQTRTQQHAKVRRPMASTAVKEGALLAVKEQDVRPNTDRCGRKPVHEIMDGAS